jgi:hypothetical protein
MAIEIAHPKIASLKPTWSPFSGWSLIFMPFGVTGDEDDLFARLRTAFGSPSQAQWSGTHHLCPLPAESYHVSYCDLINQGNMCPLVGEHALAGGSFELTAEPPRWLLRAIEDAGLNGIMPDPVEFVFSHVSTSHGRMLGVMLEPIGNSLEILLPARARLQQLLHEVCGLPQNAYSPHLTLGYFPNQEIGRRADNEAVPALQEKLKERLAGTVARFNAIGLYAFTDMISYKLLRTFRSV